MRASVMTAAAALALSYHVAMAQNPAASILAEALQTVTVSYINFASTTSSSTTPTSTPTPTIPFTAPIEMCDYVFEGVNQEGGGGGNGEWQGFQSSINNFLFSFYIADYDSNELHHHEYLDERRFTKELDGLESSVWSFSVGRADYGGTHNMYAVAEYDSGGLDFDYCRVAFDGGGWVYGTVKQDIDSNIVSTITSKCIVVHAC